MFLKRFQSISSYVSTYQAEDCTLENFSFTCGKFPFFHDTEENYRCQLIYIKEDKCILNFNKGDRVTHGSPCN